MPETTQHSAVKCGDPIHRCMLWVDRVGAFLMCGGDIVVVGGPSSASADVCLFARLASRHASFCRGSEGYWLQAGGAVSVAGRTVIERADLTSGDEIVLGESVRCRFRLPSAMSLTACLDFLSDHRPAHACDGVLLAAETVLLGPGPENHVRCPDWPESVLLYRQGTHWRVKSRAPLQMNGAIVDQNALVPANCVVTGPELRFGLEWLGGSSSDAEVRS